ncbi:MAG: hypothetical protein MJZ82_01025 [Paludibacteraceae bacterium]|nr:hypothetical protein [Paludibacteraceae bacterium]
MSTLEIILTFLSTVLGSANIIQLITVRSLKKKAQADATAEMDKVLINRINFLDERITKLEKQVCFRTDCEKRM